MTHVKKYYCKDCQEFLSKGQKAEHLKTDAFTNHRVVKTKSI